MVKIWISRLEAIIKLIGTVAASVAALAFVIPPLGTWVNVLTSARFGAIGHVYYEIGQDHQLTARDGQLYLLRPGRAMFSDLAIGDKLQAASSVNFREDANSASRPLFLLQRGDCVVILGRTREQPVQSALSGGWLQVATTSCGLFG